MKRYYAYTRVSTVRQGEHGVSLQEQKEAIERYAARHAMEIAGWFTEKETAAKTGRPIFDQMLRSLKKGQAAGVIIHKIDRSARNLKDWAEIGQLHDAGIEVHFANESVDLSSPGGMLSADVQAVVAAYYIRNLREEVKKGYYGRLKQGLCPFPAPLGYLDEGSGKPKTIDPKKGPLVAKAFELYATGKYSQQEIANELNRLGLQIRGGRQLSKNTVARILSNPFYAGEIRIKKTGQSFAGLHPPLVSRERFERVKNILAGKGTIRSRSHRFIFSRLILCAVCGRSLVGEVHKGHTYYRCHGPHLAILKEEFIDSRFSSIFDKLKLLPDEETVLDLMLQKKKANWRDEAMALLRANELRLASARDKMQRLTDAYLDGVLDREIFEQKKTALQLERAGIDREISEFQSGDRFYLAQWEKTVELIKSAYSLYKSEIFDEKREVVNKVMSNRTANGKTLDITLKFPFSEIVQRGEVAFGGAQRGPSRKFWRDLIERIVAHSQTTMVCEP